MPHALRHAPLSSRRRLPLRMAPSVHALTVRCGGIDQNESMRHPDLDASREAGGTPELDALMVGFVVKPQAWMQVEQIAAGMGYPIDRVLRAVVLMLSRGLVESTTSSLTSQSWIRLVRVVHGDLGRSQPRGRRRRSHRSPRRSEGNTADFSTARTRREAVR